MNRFYHSFLGAIIIAAFTLSVSTAFSLPLHDPFDYVDGSYLAGQLNPEGNAWGVCGTNLNPPDIIVTDQNLSYPGLAESPGNAVYFGGNSLTTDGIGYTERIAINPPNPDGTRFVLTNGTIFYSLLVRLDDLSGCDLGGGFACGFNNDVGPQGGGLTVVCGRLFFREDNNAPPIGDYQMGVARQAIQRLSATYATNVFFVGETNFVVVSYTAIGGPYDSNDVARLWINPDPSTFGAVVEPTATWTNLADNDFSLIAATNISSFVLRQGNHFVPMLTVDDLRIGPTWACVTPPTGAPAPSSVKLDVEASGTDVVVSWPTNAACFALQSASTIDATNWSTVYGTFVVEGAKFMITNAISGDTLYYRLKQF